MHFLWKDDMGVFEIYSDDVKDEIENYGVMVTVIEHGPSG